MPLLRLILVCGRTEPIPVALRQVLILIGIISHRERYDRHGGCLFEHRSSSSGWKYQNGTDFRCPTRSEVYRTHSRSTVGRYRTGNECDVSKLLVRCESRRLPCILQGHKYAIRRQRLTTAFLTSEAILVFHFIERISIGTRRSPTGVYHCYAMYGFQSFPRVCWPP